MPPKRPSLRDRASEFAQSDNVAARPDPQLHGEERPRQDVIAIPLREIMPNTRQPRTRFDEAALEELADSIRTHGVIQPVIVKAISLTNWEGAVRRYELIAGERRWRASERAGQRERPAHLQQPSRFCTKTVMRQLRPLQCCSGVIFPVCAASCSAGNSFPRSAPRSAQPSSRRLMAW